MTNAMSRLGRQIEEVIATLDRNELHPLTRDGGIDTTPGDVADPFERLDDLMQVVEALCPTYPQRGTFEGAGGFRL